MSEFDAPTPRNQDTDPRYNLEPGLVVVPGSADARMLAKFEQFPSRFTAGDAPGNPYVYRPFPKMVYRAERYNGKVVCGAAPPDPGDFKNPGEYFQAERQSQKVNNECQRIVKDERELQQAFEAGFREDPKAAVEHALARDRAVGLATAHRAYEDRNMSDAARAEIAEVERAHGGASQPEISGRKVKNARERKRRASA